MIDQKHGQTDMDSPRRESADGERLRLRPSIAVFLVVAMLGPTFGAFYYDRLHQRIPMIPDATTHPTDLAILDGTWARAIDLHFERRSDVADVLRPYWYTMAFGLFDETPRPLMVGRRRTLFWAPSIAPFDRRYAATHRARMLNTASRFLIHPHARKTRGILLLMPSKWRLHESELPTTDIPLERRRLYDEVRTEMLARGVEVPDILGRLLAEQRRDPTHLLYAPNDTHLSRAGFAFLTRTVVAGLFGLDEGEARRRLEAIPQTRETYGGDLIYPMGLSPTSLIGRRWTFEETDYLAPATADQTGSSVVLIGDSFFGHYAKLWPRLIQAVTRTPCDARATGPEYEAKILQIMSDYAGGGRLPKHIIIAVSERVFTVRQKDNE